MEVWPGGQNRTTRMAARDVTLTLPDGKTKVVVQGVPAGATFSALRRYVDGMYKVEGPFVLVAGGAAPRDDEVIDCDDVSVVYTEGSADRLLQFAFVSLQAAAVALIAAQRRNWEVIAAAAVGLAVFAAVALLARLPPSVPLGRAQFECRRFLSLFFRSMSPSFRLEHLGGRRAEAGEGE